MSGIFFERDSAFRFLRFLIVGGSATLLHYAIMGGLIFMSMASTVAASAIGYIFSTIYNYLANFRFTFGGGYSHARSLPRFILTACAGLFLNQIILTVGIYFSLPIYIPQLLATATVLVWNYLINAAWSFAKKDENR